MKPHSSWPNPAGRVSPGFHETAIERTGFQYLNKSFNSEQNLNSTQRVVST